MREAGRAVRADVVVPFRSRASLLAIKAAMIVDEREPPTSRVSVKTMLRGMRLVLRISADDISSLRAALNSNLRLVLTWIRIAAALDSHSYRAR
ncbi:hypothetical protein KEJ39_02435 [Candidatus Bathyarchaeota archaeon]|nr:hypothetical protein [Candidatus Bathyarchaeota archaeon]